MSVQLACNASEPVTYDLRRPKCPRCGSILLMAEQFRIQPQKPHSSRLVV